MFWPTPCRVSLKASLRNPGDYVHRHLGFFDPVYSSLHEHHLCDEFCENIRQKIASGLPEDENSQIREDLLCCVPRGAKRSRWVVPLILRSMVLKYFYDSVFAGHLGAFKTFREVAGNLWWPQIRTKVYRYVRKCDLCQRAKPAQNTNV